MESFLNTLTQSLSSSTRDIKEFTRIGRSLWPVYIAPLHPSRIEETVALVASNGSNNKEALEKGIIASLDQKILMHMNRYLSRGLFSLSLESPMLTLPSSAGSIQSSLPADMSEGNHQFLRVCLLIAAFLCQNNRPDQDKRIFSIEGNGKKRSRNRSSDSMMEDNMAFGSTLSEQQQLKMIRPRPFPLERMLSVFVTIVGLNPSHSKFLSGNLDRDELLQSLGSSYLNYHLSHLCELGYLHKVSYNGLVKGEQINLSSARFWCSLSRATADVLAKSVDIPLDQYVL